MLIVTGVLLLLTLLRKAPKGDIGIPKAFLIGAAQAAAMLPGISRSGATICTAIYANTDPEKAANFSFLMLLPVVLLATAIKSLDMISGAGMADASLGGAVRRDPGSLRVGRCRDQSAPECRTAGSTGLVCGILFCRRRSWPLVNRRLAIRPVAHGLSARPISLRSLQIRQKHSHTEGDVRMLALAGHRTCMRRRCLKNRRNWSNTGMDSRFDTYRPGTCARAHSPRA